MWLGIMQTIRDIFSGINSKEIRSSFPKYRTITLNKGKNYLGERKVEEVMVVDKTQGLHVRNSHINFGVIIKN